MTLADLMRIMPYANGRAPLYLPLLNDAMYEYDINTPARQAAFLAQVAHESGSLRYVHEIASGAAYEGRADLGNTQPGDGMRFKGRGLIQLTGRRWYERASVALGIDCVNHPELLEVPANATNVSAWFWDVNDLNPLADAGKFVSITKKINGGVNGLSEREAYYARAKEVLLA